jgi:hypothetical protein
VSVIPVCWAGAFAASDMGGDFKGQAVDVWRSRSAGVIVAMPLLVGFCRQRCAGGVIAVQRSPMC